MCIYIYKFFARHQSTDATPGGDSTKQPLVVSVYSANSLALRAEDTDPEMVVRLSREAGVQAGDGAAAGSVGHGVGVFNG